MPRTPLPTLPIPQTVHIPYRIPLVVRVSIILCWALGLAFVAAVLDFLGADVIPRAAAYPIGWSYWGGALMGLVSGWLFLVWIEADEVRMTRLAQATAGRLTAPFVVRRYHWAKAGSRK